MTEEAKQEEVQQEAAETKETEVTLNEDGLIPGQEVDAATARKLEKKSAKLRAEQDAKARAKTTRAKG